MMSSPQPWKPEDGTRCPSELLRWPDDAALEALVGDMDTGERCAFELGLAQSLTGRSLPAADVERWLVATSAAMKPYLLSLVPDRGRVH